MVELIEAWKKRTRRNSIAMISFALVQVTAVAGLVWRMAARNPALHANANIVALLFLCMSASFPLVALFRVIFVPAVLRPDAVVPASLLRELSLNDVAGAIVRARARAPKPTALTFRELLELDRS